MLQFSPTPLIRLGNLFPDRQVFAKCEFLAPSGCFKIRGAVHLLEHLNRDGKKPELIVPSSGNTAVGAAVAARAFGYAMTGVVPRSIAKAKDDKLRALGVDLVKIEGGGSELLRTATELAEKRGGYFVHPHLDPLWTDGYKAIANEILQSLPDCRTIVFPVGGGGLLMGLLAELRERSVSIRLVGCEPFNYPKYAEFKHQRAKTVADGLVLENPHPELQQAIADAKIDIRLVHEADIKIALKQIYESHALVVEPSSAIAVAAVRELAGSIDEPACVVLTGSNIVAEDHARLMADA